MQKCTVNQHSTHWTQIRCCCLIVAVAVLTHTSCLHRVPNSYDGRQCSAYTRYAVGSIPQLPPLLSDDVTKKVLGGGGGGN
jgi:hypothetical protein